MLSRFIVELENNHHYILVDTESGRCFYTPDQADAHGIAGLLNGYLGCLEHYRGYCRELEDCLRESGVVFRSHKSCGNCRFGVFDFLGFEDDDSLRCELFDRSVGRGDVCGRWVLE